MYVDIMHYKMKNHARCVHIYIHHCQQYIIMYVICHCTPYALCNTVCTCIQYLEVHVGKEKFVVAQVYDGRMV